MPPNFGTSGLRGLVTELTSDLVRDHVRAFLAVCDTGTGVCVGWDLRPSSPRLRDDVVAALSAAGVPVTLLGALPTPALALYAQEAGAGAIMITGSHIPADRNGLKFYTTAGEITKTDEVGITAQLDARAPLSAPAAPVTDRADAAAEGYRTRYTTAFGPEALRGMRIGVYQHSSVARDLLGAVLSELGADVVPLDRSDDFVPVDTEAVAPETRARFQHWTTQNALNALVSTDGDGDRPMVSDETGTLLPGDVLGPLTARLLGATQLCTPVSSNTLVDSLPEIAAVHRTRIGSPYVIDAMQAILDADPQASVVGYEANGGVLLGFTATLPHGPLSPLMTRDSLLPILATLALARAQGLTLSHLRGTLPARFTATDRLIGIDTARSRALIERLESDPSARRALLVPQEPEMQLDLTDGLRVTFASGNLVHLRPSGNAPELRCYVEADAQETAHSLLAAQLAQLRRHLDD